MAVVMEKFNERIIERRFYGRGSIVRVIEGNFIDKKVRLRRKIYCPNGYGNHRVAIYLDGKKAVIELYKLAL